MTALLENVVVSAVITLCLGLPLSVYAGVIVARYIAFDGVLDNARSIILGLEQEWEYRCLPKGIPDPDSPTGTRTVFMSKVLSGNHVSWLLMQIGLRMKELWHWRCAQEIDEIALEVDSLRDDFVRQAQLAPDGASKEVQEHIADWHRRLSSQRPNLWSIIKPWPIPRYKGLSCISVDEATGDWSEVRPPKSES